MFDPLVESFISIFKLLFGYYVVYIMMTSVKIIKIMIVCFYQVERRMLPQPLPSVQWTLWNFYISTFDMTCYPVSSGLVVLALYFIHNIVDVVLCLFIPIARMVSLLQYMHYRLLTASTCLCAILPDE